MRSRLRRIVAPLTVAVAAAGVGAAVGAAPAVAASSQAVVIVDTGDATITRVITFSGTISGYEALVLAGADPVTYGYAGQGAAICRLFGVGNDPGGNSCLGTPDDTRYWAYHRTPAGSEGWQYSRAGAGATHSTSWSARSRPQLSAARALLTVYQRTVAAQAATTTD